MPRIQGDLENSMRRCAAKWKSKSSSDGVKVLHGHVEDVCSDIHDLWEDRDMDKQPLIEGIKPPAAEDVMVEDISKGLARDLFKAGAMEEILKQCRFGFWDCLLAPFICIWDALESLIDLFRSDEEKLRRQAEKIDEGKVKIRPAVEAAINGREFRTKLEQPISKNFEDMLSSIEKEIRRQLDDLKVDFEKDRVAKPQSMFDKSAEERRRIAEANKAERTGVIEPLRSRIEAFAKAVTAEMPA